VIFLPLKRGVIYLGKCNPIERVGTSPNQFKYGYNGNITHVTIAAISEKTTDQTRVYSNGALLWCYTDVVMKESSTFVRLIGEVKIHLNKAGIIPTFGGKPAPQPTPKGLPQASPAISMISTGLLVEESALP
jgi:hypothetical protein